MYKCASSVDCYMVYSSVEYLVCEFSCAVVCYAGIAILHDKCAACHFVHMQLIFLQVTALDCLYFFYEYGLEKSGNCSGLTSAGYWSNCWSSCITILAGPLHEILTLT